MDIIKRCEVFQKRLVHRIKDKKQPPFGEWRLPVMILIVSSFVFILITSGVGVGINRNTGQLSIEMDWSQYIDDDGLYDPWVYDPFQAWISENKLLVICWMILLFYASICIFFYYWFEYMKWKWKRIPIEERKQIKYYKVKLPDNDLYMVELLKRRNK